MPSQKSRFLLIALFFLMTLSAGADDGKVIQARIYIDARENLGDFMKLAPDIVFRGDNYVEIVTDGEQLDRIEALGFGIEIVHDDLTAFLKSRLPKDKDMGGYKTLDEIYTYLDGIINDHPAIISQKISLGLTIEGRDIWAVKISDNPEIDEDEPEILFTSAIHSREVITPEVMFYFMDHLTDNYGSDSLATYLVDNREIWCVVVVNPDGYYHNQVIEPGGGGMWRKNRRDNGDGTFGVDLNRNFGYEWGYDDEGSSPYTSSPTYRGTGPFSEPETQIMRDFTIAHDFIISVYYHSHSNFVLYPWSYDTLHTVDNKIFVGIADSISTMNGYAPGTCWELLYPVNGGSDDWYYGEQSLKDKIFAFTLEVGSYEDNFWPPLSRVPALISENLQPNLMFAELAGNVYRILPPLPPVMDIPDTVNATGYDVAWSLDDTINPAVIYELMELQEYVHGKVDSADNLENWYNDGFSISNIRFTSYPSSFHSNTGNNLSNAIETTIPISISMNDTLKFKTYYDIEDDWDYAYVEISTDGAVFYPIEGNITTEYDPHGNNRGHGITGDSGGWIEAAFSLENYVGKNIYIRFSYITDEYTYDEGFYIDNIFPLDGYNISNIISSSIADTFYTMADKSEGVYYYKVRGRDVDGQWGMYSDINSTFAWAFLCGDVDGDKSINILDITFLIDYIYKSGPMPDPVEAADVNSSGGVNLLDITYLINFLYKSGPEPDCP